MPHYINVRTVCHFVALAVHVGNSIAMGISMRGDILKDENVKNMERQQFAFLTIWNVVFQITYLLLSLICDITRVNKRNKNFIKKIDHSKNILFESLVWPATLSVFIIFWPVFLYNREFIFPAYVDKALGVLANYLMHFFILPVVLLELVFLEGKSRRKYYKWHHSLLLTLFIIYLTVLISNYLIQGLWPYPFLYEIWGTFYFPLVVLGTALVMWGNYYLQWPLRSLLSRREKYNEQNSDEGKENERAENVALRSKDGEE